MSVGVSVEPLIVWGGRAALAVLLLSIILVYSVMALVPWPCARGLRRDPAGRPRR